LILSPEFYERPTLEVARDLIGKVLVHRAARGVTAGVIVEVEAYIGEADPACHAAVGPTARNAPLYGPPGHAYVYINYGLHHLVNAVTEPRGSPAAVLIRALQPVEGLPLMQARRGRLRWRRGKAPVPDLALCRGPGNLAAAMGIDAALNARPLFKRPLTIEDNGVSVGSIAWGPRIGITKGVEHEWRCYVEGHPSVSGARSHERGTWKNPEPRA
jgi:DNA-3-methyladenine glycosylase